MFVELMPLLAGRTVLITVAREEENVVRVNFIPRKMKEDENPALTTPLSYTGGPEELDAELGKHLASYVECHIQLGSTLAQAKSEMEAAATAAQEEARKKASERSKKPAEKPVISTGSAPVGPAPALPAATMTLFESSQAPASGATIPTAAAPPAGGGGGGENTCKLAF